MFRKSLSDELFLIFPLQVQNVTVFSTIYMIRIQNFRAAGIKTDIFQTRSNQTL